MKKIWVALFLAVMLSAGIASAQTKISELPAITTVDPANDVVPIVDVSGTAATKKATVDQLVKASLGSFISTGIVFCTTAGSVCTPSQITLGAAYSVLQVNAAGTAAEFTSSLSISALDLTSATSVIPMQVGTGTASGVTEAGRLYFESDTEILTIGDGATSINLDMAPNVTYTFPAATASLATLGANTFTTGQTIGNGNTSAGYIYFLEDSDNGTNTVQLIGPASTADVVVTLPAATDTLVGKATTDTLTNKSITAVEIVEHDDQTQLTAAQVSGGVISNAGQGAADVFLLLPAAAAGYQALFNVATAQAGNHFGVEAGANDKIYLVAAAGTVAAGDDAAGVVMTAAQAGQSFACWTFCTASTDEACTAWDWMCKAISIGTSTFAAHAHSTP